MMNKTMDLTTDIDRMVASWAFMGSPLSLLTILVSYLFFVLKLGPYLMKNEPAFNLKYVIIAYNAFQVIFSAWFCMKAFWAQENFILLFTQCNSLPPQSSYALDLLSAAWWYLFAKIVELLDTVFFVLRKKQSQVTFLHVYHHSVMLCFTWSYLKYFPGAQGAVAGFINAGVHMVMYFYYFLAALGPEYKKYLWWKKYMTWLQIAQFVLILAYMLFVIAMDCPMPTVANVFLIPIVMIFLYLFADFYIHEYRKKKRNVENEKIK